VWVVFLEFDEFRAATAAAGLIKAPANMLFPKKSLLFMMNELSLYYGVSENDKCMNKISASLPRGNRKKG
jgi:hypothetical protein